MQLLRARRPALRAIPESIVHIIKASANCGPSRFRQTVWNQTYASGSRSWIRMYAGAVKKACPELLHTSASLSKTSRFWMRPKRSRLNRLRRVSVQGHLDSECVHVVFLEYEPRLTYLPRYGRRILPRLVSEGLGPHLWKIHSILPSTFCLCSVRGKSSYAYSICCCWQKLSAMFLAIRPDRLVVASLQVCLLSSITRPW